MQISHKTNGDDLTQYEMKAFDSFYTSAKKETGTFAIIQNHTENNSVFYPIDITGKYHKNQSPEEIIKKAQEKAVLIEQEAYEKGFEQGEKDGLELGNAKAQKIAENIESLLEKISLLSSTILKIHEKEIITLICAVAEKVIGYQVELNDAVIRNTVINAINMATEKQSIRLKVNPEDFEYIDNLRPEIFQRFNELASVEIISNPAIKRGGCLLETPCGDVDARMETQLLIISKCLQEVFGENNID
ncbi:MAG: FliH/SctL family protein [Pseudomonadota bacterium]